MYSERLEELISLALADGKLTAQKRDIIKRRAEKEGEDVEEVLMVVEARLSQKTAESSAQKRKNTQKEEVCKDAVEDDFVETVNGVSFKMIRVEGGTFTMYNRDDIEEPDPDSIFVTNPDVHQCFVHMNAKIREMLKRQNVTVGDYYIGENLVTQALWKAVMGDRNNPSRLKGDNLPIHNVAWEDCEAFVKKLNKITNKDYHLPSEVQWEYAAIGGKNGFGYKFAGSDDPFKVAWGAHNTQNYTQQDMIDFYNAHHFFKAKKLTDSVVDYYNKHNYRDMFEVRPVGMLRPNELGLYDLSGNVCEFCEDDFDNEPILGKGKNPIYKEEYGFSKVERSFNCQQQPSGVGIRRSIPTNKKQLYSGFRVTLMI